MCACVDLLQKTGFADTAPVAAFAAQESRLKRGKSGAD